MITNCSEIAEPLQTAVLFLVFNRPEATSQVFEVIRSVKPTRLYVAADGPRQDRTGEIDSVAQVRKIVLNVDWPCKVFTLFRDENLGCKHAVSSAISWFFGHEESGIILEDDCLPSISFFSFCESMLLHYRNDRRVWMVSGFNPRYPGFTSSEYFASENPSVWGWATWADRWQAYDIAMESWPNTCILKYFQAKFPSYVATYYWDSFTAVRNCLIDTWDYQFTFTILSNHGLVLKAKANLISNIGVEGTHSKTKDHNHNVPLGTFDVDDLVCLPSLLPDVEEDLWFYRTRLANPLRYIIRPLKALRKLMRLRRLP